MEKEVLLNSWNYFRMIERDLDDTSQYIEPQGQQNAYSLEFSKILVLACTEVESLFKLLCKEITGESVAGNIGKYKEVILGKYPKIIEATVSISRLNESLKPFEGWDNGPLSWWGAYQSVKHDRGKCFAQATYRNAVESLSALYVLLLYLFKICDNSEPSGQGIYLSSMYRAQMILARAPKELPDFEGV